MTARAAYSIASLAALLSGCSHLQTPGDQFSGAEGSPTVLSVTRPAGPEWFGLYILGQKVGWSRMEVAREQRGGTDVLVATQESVLRASVGNRQAERRERSEKVYEARPGGRLVAFVREYEGDGGERRTEVTCTPKICRVILIAQGGTQTRERPPTTEAAERADAARLAAALRGKVVGALLDPENLGEYELKDVFKGRGTLAWAGAVLDVSVVAESSSGDRLPALISIADDGRVLEIRYGQSLVARAEPEEIARRLDKVDLVSLTRVPLDAPLPSSVPGSIVFRLRGLPPEFQMRDDRQSYAPRPDGQTVVTVSARVPAAANPERDARRSAPVTRDMKEYLRPTFEFDADDPAVSELAREVVGDSQGVFAASTRLVHFVNQRLKKSGERSSRASEVLRLGKGTSVEHTLLFVAMARAAGIPARLVTGLAYMGARAPALYWLAWAEVKAGDDWIAVDPMLDQPVADATHIALARGAQVDVVSLLGVLAVVEARPGEPP
jgi:hypothetical protein